MRIVLLDKKTLGTDLDLTALEAQGTLTTYDTSTPAQTIERIQNAEIVLTNKVVIDKEAMQEAKNLGLICVTATGMNNIDLEAAKALNITVKNVAGYSTHSVAQHTFALLLALMEQTHYYDDLVKEGHWSRSALFTDLSRPFSEITGKQWGIIGLGNIGQEVAKIATAFGATVSYHSTSGRNSTQPYPQKSLDRLLEESDILSIHAPLNAQTENLINQDNLPLLKEGSVLLNLGRGGIINEYDLAVEMNTRTLYAGLDTTAEEPIETLNPLLHLNHPHHLLITPHIAWGSKEARAKLLKGVIENIASFLEERR